MVFGVVDKTIFFHFADLGGETASLDLKIIGKLLTVKGDIKAAAVMLFCFRRKIGQQFFSGGTLGRNFDALMKHQ